MLDPHLAAELSSDVIEKMVLKMIEAHGEYMAMYNKILWDFSDEVCLAGI